MKNWTCVTKHDPIHVFQLYALGVLYLNG